MYNLCCYRHFTIVRILKIIATMNNSIMLVNEY